MHNTERSAHPAFPALAGSNYTSIGPADAAPGNRPSEGTALFTGINYNLDVGTLQLAPKFQ